VPEWRVREATADRPTHDAQAGDVVDEIWKCSEEEADVCKGAGCDDPGHAFWVGQEGITEGEDGGFGGDGWGGDCGEEIGAIETGDAWWVLEQYLGSGIMISAGLEWVDGYSGHLTMKEGGRRQIRCRLTMDVRSSDSVSAEWLRSTRI